MVQYKNIRRGWLLRDTCSEKVLMSTKLLLQLLDLIQFELFWLFLPITNRMYINLMLNQLFLLVFWKKKFMCSSLKSMKF